MKTWKKVVSMVLAVAIALSGIAMPRMQVKAADAMNPERLTLGDVWTPGEITEKGAVHFYQVSFQKAGWLTVEYQGWSIRDSYYEIWNQDMGRKYDGHEIYYSSATDPKTKTSTLALEPGTYVIKVYGYGDNIGEYRLKASFKAAGNNEYTNNNEFATSQNLSLNQAVKGFLSMDDRVDFFRVNLVKKDRIRLIYTSYVRDSYMQIYNSDFKMILDKNVYYADENNPKVYEYEETLNPGTYYIKITPSGSNCGRYTIQYKQKITVKSLSIKANKTNVVAGQKVRLSAKISPSNTTDKTIRWISGDTGIARVDENTGLVTTYRPGIVKITASAQDGSGVSKVYTMIVKPKKMPAPYLSSPKAKQLYVSYNGQYGAKAYQVQYSTNSKFKGAVTKKTSKTYFTIKNLKRNKYYYVRMRAYVQRGKTIYAGSWSKAKKQKIK